MTGKRSLKDERIDWHTSICLQHASLCHHLLQDVQLEVDGGNFLRKKVQFQWLNGDVCDRNSPNLILTRVLGLPGFKVKQHFLKKKKQRRAI